MILAKNKASSLRDLPTTKPKGNRKVVGRVSRSQRGGGDNDDGEKTTDGYSVAYIPVATVTVDC